MLLVIPLMLGACSLMIGEKLTERPCDADGSCPDGTRCEAGICVAGVVDPPDGGDPCDTVTCNPGEICEAGNCIPDGSDGGVTLRPCDPNEIDPSVLHGVCACADSESVRCRAGGSAPEGGECLCIRFTGHLGGISRTAPLGIKERRLMEGHLGISCAPATGNGIQVCGGITQ